MKKKSVQEIHNLCEKCAEKIGKHLAGVASFWEDTCDVCGKETQVTDIRDFNNNYMKEDF